MNRLLSHLGASLGVLLATLLVLAGCSPTGDYRPQAAGPNPLITVVMDSSRWEGPVGEAVRYALGEYQGTLPAPEPLFDLRVFPIDSEADFERSKTFKNVVYVAPLSDSSNEARVIQSVLAPDARDAVQSGEVPAVVVPRENQWRRDQQVFYITGSTPEAVVEGIERETEDLRYAFTSKVRERLSREMFEKGRQFDKEEQLLADHGYAVNVQHDYLFAADTTDTVWLRRILTDTWRDLLIHYEEGVDPSDITPAYIYHLRDSLSERYQQGNAGGFVEIDRRRPLETENVNFLGRYGFETRGLWHMVGYGADGELEPHGQGGPFVNYTFYDEDTGRLYMIDGMVFAPGFDKREFLRQMEAIAHTFRTADDERRAQDS